MRIHKDKPLSSPLFNETQLMLSNGVELEVPFVDNVNTRAQYDVLFSDGEEIAHTLDELGTGEGSYGSNSYGDEIGYAYAQVKMEDLISLYAATTSDYVNVVCEVKIDQARKDAGGNVTVRLWKENADLTVEGDMVEQVVTSTEWTKVNISVPITDLIGATGEATALFCAETYNLDSSIETGFTYSRNRAIYLSKGAPVDVSQVEIAPTYENVVVSPTGAYFGKGKTNLIADGCFENNTHAAIINPLDSWWEDKYNPGAHSGIGGWNIVEMDNPMSSISNRVLEGSERGEYDIYFDNTKILQNKTYTMSCWVSYDNNYAGQDEIFHSRVHHIDGVHKSTNSVPGTTFDKVIINGRVWERRYLTFTTDDRAVDYTKWFLGYDGTGTSDLTGAKRYFTGLMMHEGDKPSEYVNGTTVDSAYSLGDPTGIINKSEHTILMEVMSDGTGFGTEEDWSMAYSVSNKFYLGWNNMTSMTVSLVDANLVQKYLTVDGLSFEHKRKYIVGYTFKDGTITMYVNGKIVGTKGIGTPTCEFRSNPEDAMELFVGTFYNRGSYSMHGWVRNFKIYNRALSEEDMQSSAAVINASDEAVYAHSINEFMYEDIGAMVNFPLDNLHSIDRSLYIPATTVTPKDMYTGITNLKIGNEILPVYVDRGWVRVFSHDSMTNTNKFTDNTEAKWCNSTDPMSNKYSILRELEQFRNKDGKFFFKLRYPNEVEEVEKYTNYWKQTSNPTFEAVANYEPIRIGYNGNYWGGLEYNGSATLCDGSINEGTWFHSVGQRATWSTGNPGPGIPVQKTELWIQCDDLGGLIFDENGCWVGTAYENLFKVNTDNTWPVKSGRSFTTLQNVDGNVVYEYDYEPAETWNYKGYDIDTPIGLDYYIECELNPSSDLTQNGVGYFKIERYNLSHSLYLSSSERDGWYQKSNQFTSNGTLTRFLLYSRANHPDVETGTIKMRNPMVTQSSFPRPFIRDKVGDSSLTIDITEFTNKTWEDDWTIAYWKKPMGTADGTMSGNSFERINKGGTTYFIGKSITGDKYVSSHQGVASGTVDFNGEYFGKWQLIIMSKNGTQLTTRCAYPITHTFATTITESAESIIFNTGNGDSASHTNAYYRDFMFFDRVLTENEITMLYGRKAKVTKQGLNVLNGVIEE